MFSCIMNMTKSVCQAQKWSNSQLNQLGGKIMGAFEYYSACGVPAKSYLFYFLNLCPDVVLKNTIFRNAEKKNIYIYAKM